MASFRDTPLRPASVTKPLRRLCAPKLAGSRPALAASFFTTWFIPLADNLPSMTPAGETARKNWPGINACRLKPCFKRLSSPAKHRHFTSDALLVGLGPGDAVKVAARHHGQILDARLGHLGPAAAASGEGEEEKRSVSGAAQVIPASGEHSVQNVQGGRTLLLGTEPLLGLAPPGSGQ